MWLGFLELGSRMMGGMESVCSCYSSGGRMCWMSFSMSVLDLLSFFLICVLFV